MRLRSIQPGQAAAAPPLPRWTVSSFSLGWSLRRRMDSAPPPLLCSVIQTWKVNNTLTSSGVCVLLHGYFPEYLALSKRGALDCTSEAPSGVCSPGEARLLWPGPFFPQGVPPGHQLGTDGGFCSKSRCTLDIDTDSFWLGGCTQKSPSSDLHFF